MVLNEKTALIQTGFLPSKKEHLKNNILWKYKSQHYWKQKEFTWHELKN